MKIFSLAIALILFGSSTAFANEALGTWTNEDGGSKINITECGDKLCGKLIWLKTPRKDLKNIDESKRNRDLLGITLFNDLAPSGNNTWIGSSYSPKKGKVYSGSATVKGDRLTLKGCLTSARILCQTVKFNRGS